MLFQEPPPPHPVVSEILASRIPVPSPIIAFDDVLILDRGDNSRVVPSGLYWVVIAVRGQLPDGERRYFYKTVFVGPGEPVPPVSGLCRIEAHQTEWTGGMISGENDLHRIGHGPSSFEPVPMWSIDRFDCSISSDSPVLPPKGASVWERGGGNLEDQDD
ncbi:hypothetical protein GGQ87_003005 [Brevundimonas alba]|uniref:Uncharacterized protein n=1 Tax=Brevundimonas alba TaxID=74314 RepID=A0A7X6BQB9_9CAUL|nr:hypothetical protein [Brevundimonas alba]NJC42710.1 hypothetical protein [Brevundimonas alba]